MKNLLALILAVSLVATLLFYKVSPCDTPVEYRIDTVDPRFNITKEELAGDVDEAQKIWSKAYGRNLFVYNSNGKLSINLVFDKRQQLKNEIGQMENQVKTQEKTIKPEISAYENEVAIFKQKLADYNSRVNFWNSKGGAPPETFKQLNQEQQTLKSEADRLNAISKQLNQTTTDFNTQVNELNQTVDTFNTKLVSRPEEGVYEPQLNKITVFFNISQPELVHTLAHELGHVLQIEHVNNQEAIMFSKTNQSLTLFPEDLSGLQKACQPKPGWWFMQKFVKVNILNE